MKQSLRRKTHHMSTKREHAKILALAEQGVKSVDIAERFGMSGAAVADIVRKSKVSDG